MRQKMKKRKDRKVFNATANKTKSINVKPIPVRGGIHL